MKVGRNPGKVVLRWSKWVKGVLILVKSCYGGLNGSK